MCEKTRSTCGSLAIKKTPKTTLAHRTERCANLSRQGMPRITHSRLHHSSAARSDATFLAQAGALQARQHLLDEIGHCCKIIEKTYRGACKPGFAHFDHL